ncbi:SET domain-containing protein 4 [Planococcus citri]|uniref:SET domain-containing protein 4 n=1 Tax=Planococcus citri TaxID=170843 RepID=UPI0031F8C90F
MGRALRIRKRKNKNKKNETASFSRDVEYLELIQWMKEHGWKPSCKLVSSHFTKTGRGLMAKERIFAGTAIAKIPYKLLITVKTVLQSDIKWIFTNKNAFITQQVLSAFLVWEHHLGELSVWKKYMNCLPKTFSCPVFCSDIDWLPKTIREKVLDMKDKVMKTFNSILNCIGFHKCIHCGINLSDIFIYDVYLWAWCVVSTRAVYLSPKINSQNSILLTDENNLALAPYVDLFNHSYDSEVKAYAVESEGIYQIETLIPFLKNEQIFINYGPLSNDRLFIDYGFIIPSNIQDDVAFSYENVLSATNQLFPSNKPINEFRLKFLKQRNLFSKICCYAGGISWDCQALIYVFICSPEVNIEEIKLNIFSDRFKLLCSANIARVAELLLATKYEDYKHELNVLKQHHSNPAIREDCFSAACMLYEEHLSLLNKCKTSLKDNKE